jgi:hypothetical protein
MKQSDIKKVVDAIEYEHTRRDLRHTFLKKGVKFYDQGGWGYIKNGVKTYMPPESDN